MRSDPPSEPPGATAEAWFAAQGWTPFAFQREVWAAMAAGESGLLHATTGSGKTYAVWLGALARRSAAAGLQVLWITPMRALASDTAQALARPLPDVAPGFGLAQRTGDTTAAERQRQERQRPQALVTTPESLSLLLTRADAEAELRHVHTVVVDEWHELIGSKRGVQVQLALARLRRWNPRLLTWGLSATLGNLEEAMSTLAGTGGARLVQGRIDKRLVIDTLLPEAPARFSWPGQLGLRMLDAVVREIEPAGTCLVFTNVRSQSEIWYQRLLEARPDWAGAIALHHGSLDRSLREWVEQGLKEGRLKVVVATSSLDLGVDFLPVERVLQIGSPKGVARLLQRAGRSGHAPGRASRATLVPTQLFELLEAAALRRAAQAGAIEARRSPRKPMDVLVQHLVTVALGGGFEAEPLPGGGWGAPALFEEVRGAPAYRDLTREEFDWALAFAGQGGTSLAAYPQYHRLQVVDGRFRVTDRGIAHRHRLQVGTIVSETTMRLRMLGGAALGTVDESFISRLAPGDCFWFGGRLLEFVRVRELTAYVTRATKKSGRIPVWSGTRMALSDELANALRELLHEAARGEFSEPEMRAARPMLELQAGVSRLPGPEELLVERHRSREGHHLWIYPFAGGPVHLGLAGLLAWRLAQVEANTFSLAVNEYGLELLSARPLDLAPLLGGSIFAAERLEADLLASLDARQLAQRRFREIARVAGLVFGGYPGAAKSARQLQASSGLFYDVFRQYDPDNLLLAQARNEALAQELEIGRLEATLRRLAAQRVLLVELKEPSPLAVPLMVERWREQLSNEKLAQRLARILGEPDAG
ncbi:ligase-associated DNA damage response DEXH box helicase [Azohydromonas australica]|uniref:ligase-associated DNA damage response DEXH box helicase n=1 Tax=Azohydromonas australica TaxID=364039 RepID=UPI0003FEA20A|nr:ligase-associated DNA damage response DEXH box helicase [Azohydromonas australica]